MILLDTSVLVTYLRTRSAAMQKVLDGGGIGVCGATRAELLHGAKDDFDMRRLTAVLDHFVQVPIPQETWDHTGRHLSQLRRAGLLFPFPDVLIATLAVLGNHEVWTFDNHFALMKSVLGSLRLFTGPTP